VVLERAPNANLIVDHVLNEGDIATSSWRVATKMARFAEAGVTVLNISFGAATDDDKPPLVLKRAVEVLNRHGVVVVAAAGNHGPAAKPIWPAALHEDGANVVAVGAGKPDDTGRFVSAAFSPDASWVDLIAPGDDICSTYKASGYATWSGTSFAAAAVTGTVAFLVQTQNMTAIKAVHWLKTPPAERKEPTVGALSDDIGPRA
jgi:subtilisin family serine protease